MKQSQDTSIYQLTYWACGLALEKTWDCDGRWYLQTRGEDTRDLMGWTNSKKAPETHSEWYIHGRFFFLICQWLELYDNRKFPFALDQLKCTKMKLVDWSGGREGVLKPAQQQVYSGLIRGQVLSIWYQWRGKLLMYEPDKKDFETLFIFSHLTLYQLYR